MMANKERKSIRFLAVDVLVVCRNREWENNHHLYNEIKIKVADGKISMEA
jgi:hypothetical protein